MEKTLIVANWKENKTASQTTEWFEKFSNPNSFRFAKQPSDGQIPNGAEIVVCPSFVLIPVLHSSLSSANPFSLYLGAQDVSKFEEGQYTGEVSAKMLKDFVKYVIVGHSERRKYFGETDEDVNLKIEQCLKYGLVPIICISNVEEAGRLKLDKPVFAYEPLFAVGTGIPDTPENANDFARKIKNEVGRDVRVLYGGSVNAENAKLFVSQPDISGVLVGQGSLDAGEFANIIETLNH